MPGLLPESGFGLGQSLLGRKNEYTLLRLPGKNSGYPGEIVCLFGFRGRERTFRPLPHSHERLPPHQTVFRAKNLSLRDSAFLPAPWASGRAKHLSCKESHSVLGILLWRCRIQPCLRDHLGRLEHAASGKGMMLLK